MSLKDIERKLESFFEGLFTKGFKTGVQPIELAKKLIKEMDTHKTISVGKVYAPNNYKITISMQDIKSLKPFESVLISDLVDYLISHAKQQKYALTERPTIEIEGDENLSLGQVKISSCLAASEEKETEEKDQTQLILPEEARELGVFLKPRACLMLQSPTETLTFPLSKKTTLLGRLHTNDIVLEDPNVSRVHAEIKLEDDRFIIYDLGSTNGTFVNGRPQKKWVLQDGDVIVLGETELHFKE
jgi:hypothetical protein